MLPFFHVFAMTVVMNFGIAKAAEIVIMPRFVLDEALKLIDKTAPDDHAGRADPLQRDPEPSEDQEPTICRASSSACREGRRCRSR